MPTGGELLVSCLKAQGVERVFCVPGESYLAVLDALYQNGPEIVVARHEGGAAMMAEADGKMTGRPGVCFVTRGPGATNASAGVHIARQDSTPMVLFVGQIARDMRGREAFQEVDYRAFFGSMAKWVEEIDQVDRIPEIISHAWHIAMSGRPGPVVLALPEDMLREVSNVKPCKQVEVPESAPDPIQMDRLGKRLAEAKSPMLVVGGSRWRKQDVANLADFSERWSLPTAVTFRRQYLFDQTHPCYAGDAGLGINPALDNRLRESDLLILLGCRFSENASQSFSVLDIPGSAQGLAHVHPGPEEIGRIYHPEFSLVATPGAFLDAALKWEPVAGWNQESETAHAAYLAWTETPPAGVGDVTMSHVISILRKNLPRDAILANGAGNYAIWLHRYYRYSWDSQLAPTSGSMGYGLPAAIAAAKRNPDKTVFAIAGDGCFQMTGMEFGVACEHGLNIKVLVCDNSQYGTIRMHQARDYPGRIVATQMKNPDFAKWAESYGVPSFEVSKNSEFETVLNSSLAEKGPALIHLRLDARDIAPGKTVSDIG